MTIDHKEWAELSAAVAAVKRQEAPIQIRSVEMDVVWEDLVGWMREQVEAKEEEAVQAMNAFQQSGDYSHVSLARHKCLLDIRQAEVLLLRNIAAKISNYHNMSKGGSQ